jgi:exodeoxyribonuclease VII large subunit
VIAARVAALDPSVQLGRGWTITRDEQGRVVRSAAELHARDVIRTFFVDGNATSTVDTVDPVPTNDREPRP